MPQSNAVGVDEVAANYAIAAQLGPPDNAYASARSPRSTSPAMSPTPLGFFEMQGSASLGGLTSAAATELHIRVIQDFREQGKIEKRT